MHVSLLLALVPLLPLQEPPPTSYHVDAETGDDAAAGTAPSTAWKSLSKVGASQALLKPGDRVLFRKGQMFAGSLKIRASGREGRPILYGAYGEGARPELTGFVDPADWKSAGNGIWEARLPAGPSPNVVSVDGLTRPLGRFPNAGYLSVDSHDGKTSITDAELPEAPDWTGAEAVIRKYRWVLDRARVTKHAGRALFLAASSTYDVVDGHGYFLQNHPAALDTFGEWCFDPSSRSLKVFLGKAEPAKGSIRASAVDVLLSARDQRDLVFEGLRLSGANRAALELDGASRIRVRDLEIVASGVDAVRGSRVDAFVMEDSRIEDTNNNGIVLDQGVSRSTLRRVALDRTGTRAGMGGSGDGTYNAVAMLGGSDNLIEELTVTRTGYLPIHFGGARATVRDCFIQDFAFVKDDAGGIYAYTGPNPAAPTPGRAIVGNVILDGRGAADGALGETKAFGIYLDDVTSDLEVRGNTVARADAGLFLHNAFRCRVSRNTFFDNRVQLLITHDGIPGAEIRDIEFRENTLIGRIAEQGLLWATSLSEDFAKFGTFEGNVYARPADPNLGIRHGIRDRRPRALDLEGHRALTGLDATSRPASVALAPRAIRPLGPNLVSNGDFAKDFKGASCWSAPKNAELAWVDGGLDGGCLHHRYGRASGSPQTSLLMVPAGALQAGRSYLLKYSVRGTAKHGSAGVKLREGSAPWGPLTEAQDARMDTARREVELLFRAPRAQAASSVEWSFSEEDGTFWLDNVSLREAEAAEPDPGIFLFEANASKTPRTIPLAGPWVDVDGKAYAGSVTLGPRASVVLIRKDALR